MTARTGKLTRLGRLALRQALRDPLGALRLGGHLVREERRDAKARLSAWLNGLACTEAASDYAAWRAAHDTLSEQDREALRQRGRSLPYRPVFSILMPTYQSPIGYLESALASVRGQLYENWELCIADDASPDPEVRRVIDAAAAQDGRIKVMHRPTNGNISAASNSALALATGEFVALMDHDDILAPHALSMMAEALNETPGLDILYSDEDKIDQVGTPYSPHFKMPWNTDLLVGQNIINHLGVYRTALVREVSGFREGLEGSQDHDLALRVADASMPERIRHVPWVLYHWRVFGASGSFSSTQGGRAVEAARKAVADHLARRGEKATLEPSSYGTIRVRRHAREPRPPVTLCGLSIGEADLAALATAARWPDLEILTGSDARALADRARGDFLVFVDRPCGVAADWLDPLVAHLQRTDVGAVGPAVIGPGDTVDQGPLAEAGGVIFSPYAGKPWATTGYFGRLHMAQRCFSLALTGLATPRQALLDSGEALSDAASVTRHCVALRGMGLATVWDPEVILTVKKHRPFRTCDTGRKSGWDGADFGNPCLSQDDGCFTFHTSPKRSRPWERCCLGNDTIGR